MKQRSIIGKVDPMLKARIENIQWQIDRVLFEYGLTGKYANIIPEVLRALFERKRILVKQI